MLDGLLLNGIIDTFATVALVSLLVSIYGIIIYLFAKKDETKTKKAKKYIFYGLLIFILSLIITLILDAIKYAPA